MNRFAEVATKVLLKIELKNDQPTKAVYISFCAFYKIFIVEMSF
jgi:hypothetical protein